MEVRYVYSLEKPTEIPMFEISSETDPVDFYNFLEDLDKPILKSELAFGEEKDNYFITSGGIKYPIEQTSKEDTESVREQMKKLLEKNVC